MDFTPNKPLLVDGNGGDRLLFRGTFGKCINGVGVIWDTRDSNAIRFDVINASILALCNFAINDIGNVGNPSRYIHSDSIPFDSWYKRNVYCYEIIALRTPIPKL